METVRHFSHIKDEVSEKVAGIVIDRRNPVEPIVGVSGGPASVEVDVHLREVAAGRKGRTVSTPIRVWAVTGPRLGLNTRWSSGQPSVPLAVSRGDSVRVSAHAV